MSSRGIYHQPDASEGALRPDQYVRLTEGTTAVLDMGASEGADRYSRFVVGVGAGEGTEDVPLRVQHVGVSHATMNGGGRDYELLDEASGYTVWVRTTFARPERSTFRAVA